MQSSSSIKPANRSRRQINFNSPLNVVLLNVHSGEVRLSAPARRLLSDLFNRFTWKLVRQFIENCKKRNSTLHGALHGVVEAVFDKALREYVMGEAQKAVFKFETGVLKYRPKLSRAQERLKREASSKRSKKIRAADFEPALRHIYRDVDPTASVQKLALNQAADILRILSETMLAELKDKTRDKDLVEALDVKKAVDRIMPRRMADHAHGAGLKSVYLHELGALQFPTELDEPLKRKKQGTPFVALGLMPLTNSRK